jgi:hypothetical protein
MRVAQKVHFPVGPAVTGLDARVNMTPEEYLEARLDQQIHWYSAKSRSNQIWFRVLRLIEIAFASASPFLVNQITADTAALKIIVGSMGVCVAVIAGIVSLYRFQENWIEYRATAESLKHEKFLFLTKSPPYEGENSFHAFVSNVESLISKENTNWSGALREKPKTKDEE